MTPETWAILQGALIGYALAQIGRALGALLNR